MHRWIPFLEQSQQWMFASRGIDVMHQAGLSLRDCFGVDSGLFLFKKHTTRVDIADGRWGVYAPWGIFANDLPVAFRIDLDVASTTIQEIWRQWIFREEWSAIFDFEPGLRDYIQSTPLQAIGLWPLQSGATDALVVVGVKDVQDLPDVAAMAACGMQIMSALDTVQIRFGSQMAKSFLESSGDAICIFDLEGHVANINPSYVDTFGWNEAELLGVKTPFGDSELTEALNAFLAGAKEGESHTRLRSYVKHKDGRQFPVLATLFAIRNTEGQLTAIGAILHDLTQAVEAEEQLRRAERLALAGTLAAGVAHELRNPLTTVKGFMQLLEEELSERRRELDIVKSGIRDMESTVNEFLLLAKSPAALGIPVDVREIVSQVTNSFQLDLVRHRIRLMSDWEETVPLIHSDAAAIKQVVTHVLRNAVDALSGWDGDRKIHVSACMDGQTHVQIVVTDNGPGMSESQLVRAGEPIYSNNTQGTGLGLMVCRRLMMNLQGEFHIRSKLGFGTTVNMRLPIKTGA